uniref:Conserved oligomeric Golgi complex subunit 8 n=1 Tax=Globodera rostochiensis TaxID=31243 RepID=A0A914GU48_GLORO
MWDYRPRVVLARMHLYKQICPIWDSREIRYSIMPRKTLLSPRQRSTRRQTLNCLTMNLMEGKGFSESEIHSKVNEYRKLLFNEFESGRLDMDTELDVRNTHSRAKVAKDNRDKWRSALGIDAAFVDGSSLEKLKKASDSVIELTKTMDKKNLDKEMEKSLMEKLMEKIKKEKEKKKERKKMRRAMRKESSSDSSDSSSDSSTSSDSDDSSSTTTTDSSSEDERAKRKGKAKRKRSEETKVKKEPEQNDPSTMTLNIEERIAIEKEFTSLSFGELNSEKVRVGSRIQHLQNELSELAFHNYRTYVDVGRTAEHCREMFVEMNGFMQRLLLEFPDLIAGIKQAREDSERIFEEYKLLNDVESTNNFIWQVLKLPKLMERYIRTGRYEQAYSLTNFAISLKQSKFTQTNAMLKNVVEVLIEARHNLLDELFSKFAAPIDLARSIQIVNNIRKIPYISNLQLRESILQYRDIYMDKHVLYAMSEPDFLFRIIDIYRECMYDTIVLYLAVFPDCEAQRKFASSNEDPRWERWTGSSQTFLLQSWAQRNIEKLFSFLHRSEVKNCLDIEVMHSKLMREKWKQRQIALQRLDLIDGDIFENTRQDIEDSGNSAIDLGILSAPLELCIWDDICVFGNLIIDVLNDLRHSLSIVLIRQVFGVILLSMQNVFKWVDAFLSAPDGILSAKRAISLLLNGQFFRSSHCSVEAYREAFKLRSKELFVLCKHESVFNEILADVQLNENAANSEWQNANEAEKDNSDGWERLGKEGEVTTEKSKASEPMKLVGEMEIEGEAEERSAEDQIDI